MSSQALAPDDSVDDCRLALEAVAREFVNRGAPIGNCLVEPIDLESENPMFRVLVEVKDETWPIDDYLEFRRALTTAALHAPCTMPVVVELGAGY